MMTSCIPYIMLDYSMKLSKLYQRSWWDIFCARQRDHRDKSRGTLELSQRAYQLCPFNMDDCSPIEAPIVRADRFSKSQCFYEWRKNQLNRFLMYLQLEVWCIYKSILFLTSLIVGMLWRFQSNLGMDHQNLGKLFFRELRISCLHSVEVTNFVLSNTTIQMLQ